MTSDTLQPKPFPDRTAAEASSSHPDTSSRGALLRALLAGAAALLVLLLPGQLAASRGGDEGRTGCRNEACAIGERTALDGPSRWDRAGALEIRRHDTC
jgi:hypothetical protein